MNHNKSFFTVYSNSTGNTPSATHQTTVTYNSGSNHAHLMGGPSGGRRNNTVTTTVTTSSSTATPTRPNSTSKPHLNNCFGSNNDVLGGAANTPANNSEVRNAE